MADTTAPEPCRVGTCLPRTMGSAIAAARVQSVRIVAARCCGWWGGRASRGEFGAWADREDSLWCVRSRARRCWQRDGPDWRQRGRLHQVLSFTLRRKRLIRGGGRGSFNVARMQLHSRRRAASPSALPPQPSFANIAHLPTCPPCAAPVHCGAQASRSELSESESRPTRRSSSRICRA